MPDEIKLDRERVYEELTGRGMPDVELIAALDRAETGVSVEPSECSRLASFLRTVAQSFGSLSDRENEQRMKVLRAADLLAAVQPQALEPVGEEQ